MASSANAVKAPENPSARAPEPLGNGAEKIVGGLKSGELGAEGATRLPPGSACPIFTTTGPPGVEIVTGVAFAEETAKLAIPVNAAFMHPRIQRIVCLFLLV